MSELEPAVSGEDLRLDARAGPLTVRVVGHGDPLILVHSINAAGSAAEMAPVHEWAKNHFHVFTPDLPGFGRSDRSDRDYHLRLYTDAVHDVVDAATEAAGRPPVVLATSLSGEFAARAAVERPGSIRALVLATPTGLDKRSERRRGEPGSSVGSERVHRVLSGAAGRFLFRQLSRPPVIRYFLKRTFGSKEIDENLWRYDCRTVRVPGAHHAPIAFLAARLFAADIRDVLEAVPVPVWLVHGTRGDFADFSGADWTEDRDNWTRTPMDTGALPWFQARDAFLNHLERYLGDLHLGEHAAPAR